MYQKFLGKLILSGQIECVTSLHIGGTTTGIEIGGVDNPVIKDPLTDQPYIPGSSLKGKLRHICEWSYGLIEKHPKHHSYQAYDCHELKSPLPDQNQKKEFDRWQAAFMVGRLFGAATDDNEIREKAGPTRLTVRDSFLYQGKQGEQGWAERLQETLGRGFFTEVKTENALDRVTSEANPRPIELVPAGSQFELSFVIDIYDPEDKQLLRDLFAAMRILEQSSLGGSGSRGHGQIQFKNLNLVWKSVQYYRGQAELVSVVIPEDLEKATKEFDQIQWPI